ncbi:ArsR/SmtB family transcription factor [Nafulsella turpanensis]|uniref:ArsR/SmtB family transcription factor n=1 Tax=Nafulsella turpanensis TaxID=1265690 RepID=UPI00037D3DC7|nr:helix-turn-helix transcriptional regulator [Nafulsella turpanensis]
MKNLSNKPANQNKKNNQGAEIFCPMCSCIKPKEYKGWAEESKLCLDGGISKSYRRMDGKENEIKNGKIVRPDWLEVHLAIQQLQPISPLKLSEVVKMSIRQVVRHLNELQKAGWIKEAFTERSEVSGEMVKYYSDVNGVPEKKPECCIQF